MAGYNRLTQVPAFHPMAVRATPVPRSPVTRPPRQPRPRILTVRAPNPSEALIAQQAIQQQNSAVKQNPILAAKAQDMRNQYAVSAADRQLREQAVNASVNPQLFAAG